MFGMSKDSWMSWVVKLLIALVSFPIVGPFKLASWLNKKVYTWRSVGWHFLCGGVLSTASAIGVYGLVATGGDLGFPLWGVNAWLAVPHTNLALQLSLATFALMAVYGYPLVWLGALQWLWKMWNAYYKRVTRFFSRAAGGNEQYETNGAKFAREATKLFRVLPGSQKVWDALVAQQNDSFFVGFQAIVAGIGLLWASWKVASAVFAAFHTLLSASVLSAVVTTLGAFVALFVFGLVALPVVKFLRTGKVYALGVFAMIAAAYATCVYVVPFAAMGTVGAWLLPVVLPWLAFAYAYPLLTRWLSNKALKKAYESIKPMFESVYDDKAPGFKEFFQQVLSIAVTSALVGALWWLLTLSQLPLWAAVAWMIALPVVAFSSYSLLGEMLDWTGGNYVVGAAFTVAAALFTFIGMGMEGWGHVLLVTVPTTVVAALLTFFLLFPLAYSVLRWCFTLPGVSALTNWAGQGLHAMHTRAWKLFDSAVRACERVYRSAYRDETPEFRRLANHFYNIVTTCLVALGVWYLCSSNGVNFWVTYAGAVIAFLFSYVLGKKLVYRDKVEPIGAITAVVKAVVIGFAVRHATPFGMLFAVPFAIVAAGFIHFFLFPLMYIAARKVLDPWFTSFALPLLDGLYGFVENRFGFVIKRMEKLFRFLTPYFNWLIKLLAAGWAFCVDAWNSIFGRRRG